METGKICENQPYQLYINLEYRGVNESYLMQSFKDVQSNRPEWLERRNDLIGLALIVNFSIAWRSNLWKPQKILMMSLPTI